MERIKEIERKELKRKERKGVTGKDLLILLGGQIFLVDHMDQNGGRQTGRQPLNIKRRHL
jgi:hypothetical protein